MPRNDPQLNIRLSYEQNEVLEAAAWVKRVSKMDLGKEAIESMLKRFAKEPAVQDALAARQRADAEHRKKVRSIDSSTPRHPKT
ncbi:MAG TPA: hypothetical protein VIG78_06735 [Gemmatimonadaceae bacterium]